MACMQTTAFDSLEGIYGHILDELVRGVADPRHAWHWPALGSVDEGTPAQRIVVLRRVIRPAKGSGGAPVLQIHTDQRSAKVRQLEPGPQGMPAGCSLLFYNPRRRIQLRLQARCRLHHQDAAAREAWGCLPARSRWTYAVERAPGTPIEHPPGPPEAEGGLDEARRSAVGSGSSDAGAAQASGFEHFTLVVCTAVLLDWLWLGSGGHRRARFWWADGVGAGSWAGQWVQP